MALMATLYNFTGSCCSSSSVMPYVTGECFDAISEGLAGLIRWWWKWSYGCHEHGSPIPVSTKMIS